MKSRAATQSSGRSTDLSAAAHKNGFSLISPAKLRQLHDTMLKCNLIERRARSISRTRSSRKLNGGEAIVVGVAIDLRSGDWIAPQPGDLAASFVKGAPLSDLMAPCLSDDPRAGASDRKIAPLNIIPSAVSISARLNISTGIALAAKAEGSGNIVVVFTGATLGDLGDELGFAAAHALPILLIAHNRRVAGSPQASKIRKAAKIDANLHASGIPIIPVDAHDVVAIYRVAHESIQKARQGVGPTIIEATAFPSATADRGRLSDLETNDPIGKMQNYLAAKGLYSAKRQRVVLEKFQEKLDAIEFGGFPASRVLD
jgi:TPP-dependent pyruvate/acetoin dehydrogenase alpha subunit